MRMQQIRILTSIGVGAFLFFGQAVAGFENNKKYPIADYENFRLVNQTHLVIGYGRTAETGVKFFVPTTMSLDCFYKQEGRTRPPFVSGREVRDQDGAWNNEGMLKIFAVNHVTLSRHDWNRWLSLCEGRPGVSRLPTDCVERTIAAFFVYQKKSNCIQEASLEDMNAFNVEVETADDGVCCRWVFRPLIAWLIRDVRFGKN